MLPLFIFLFLLESTSSNLISGTFNINITGINYNTKYAYYGNVIIEKDQIRASVMDHRGGLFFRYDEFPYVVLVGDEMTEICLDGGVDLNAVFSVLDQGVRVEGFNEVVEGWCPGRKWVFGIEGNSFVVCERDDGFGVLSPDFEMSLVRSDEVFEMERPGIECEKVGSLKRSVMDLHSTSQWYKKSVPNQLDKTCVFLHGSGVRNNQRMSKFITGYWGDIKMATRQCKDHIFIQTNTFSRTWYDKDLMVEFCNTSVSDQETEKYLIQDKIIFTHSMGNLILGQAILEGFCDLDTSSTWYAACAPLNGSRAALYLQKICDASKSLPAWVSAEFCENGKPEPAYESMVPGFPGLDTVRKLVSDKTSGSMCGLSATGLNSIYSVGLVLVEEIVNLEKPNDGLVASLSCLQDKPYESTYKSPYYTASINHADGTCRNGDSWFGGEDKKPCAWYGSQT